MRRLLELPFATDEVVRGAVASSPEFGVTFEHRDFALGERFSWLDALLIK
jgi:hypothetical protein